MGTGESQPGLEAVGSCRTVSEKTRLRECLMLADILRDCGGRGHGVELVMMPYQTKQTEKQNSHFGEKKNNPNYVGKEKES